MQSFECCRVSSMVPSPTGRYIVGMTGGAVILIDPYSGKTQPIAQGFSSRMDRFKTIVVGWKGDKPACLSLSSDIIIRRVGPGVDEAPVRCNEPATCSAFSPDAALLFVGTDEGRVFSMNVDAPHQRVVGLAKHSSIVTCIAADAKGPAFVTGSHDGTVKVWDAASLELLHSIDFATPITRVAIRGKRVVAVTIRKEVFAVDISGSPVATCRACDTDNDIFITPDCLYMIEQDLPCGKVIPLWDLAAEQKRLLLSALQYGRHATTVTDHAFIWQDDRDRIHIDPIPVMPPGTSTTPGVVVGDDKVRAAIFKPTPPTEPVGADGDDSDSDDDSDEEDDDGDDDTESALSGFEIIRSKK